MKNLFVCFLALIISSATAQKIVLTSEITEADRIALTNKYANDNFNKKNVESLHARMDSAIKLVFPVTPKNGIALFFEAMVGTEGKVDLVIFDLMYAQKYNRDSLAGKFKAAFASQMSIYKAPVPGAAFVRTFSIGIGPIKVPRQVRQTDSSLIDVASLVTYTDTLRIKKLFLNDLELKEIPQTIYRYPNLEELYLGSNEITEVNLNMSRLPKLRQLHLQGNQITGENFKISPNKTLNLLNLKENKLSDIPAAARNCKRLDILWLGGNQLSKLTSSSFKRFKNLKDLNFYKSGIAVLPKGIKKMHHLEVLDLYYNELEQLPKTITRLRRLTHLAVSNNQLTSLPKKIDKLKKIHTLYAHHNHLSKLPERITKMKNLKILDLGYNWFTNFPQELTSFNTLEELDLSSNNFTEFPSQLLSIKRLDKLYLRGNPFAGENAEAKYGQQLGQLKSKNIEVFY